MTANETASTAPAPSTAEATRRPTERQLRLLVDRAEITDLLGRYLRSLDEGVFDEAWGRAFYAEDATARMPIGTVRGRDAVVARIREGMALFDRTVHLGGTAVIEVDGDRATARAPQLSTHVLADGSQALFVSGGQADTELVRTPDGWRIAASALHIAWTRGTPPRLPAGWGPAESA
ncbi:nuclear transport factor 2 family protein [Streptomyces sp. NPDC093707]|uniref:nuclear transport factor 2 family protein n=1 Tax=Streptomyces sp. NPDC093707 TaxID=3154984 RepID=UPI00344C64C6